MVATRRTSGLHLTSFTAALCASLVLHAVLIACARQLYVRSLASLSMLPVSAAPATTPHSDGGPLMLPPKPPALPDFALGRADGTGTATDDSPGDEPLTAPPAEQDQPLLSRDPAGPGRFRDEPSPSIAPPGEGGAGGDGANGGDDTAAPMIGSPAVSRLDESRESARPVSDESEQTVGSELSESSRRATVTSVADAQRDTRAASETARANENGAAGAPGAPGAPVRPADPAPQGESESDAFTTSPQIDFRGGRIDARIGRRHRIIQPRINLAGLVDMVALRDDITLVLELRIDSTGKVTSAAVLHATGSEQVDQAWRLASYEWWFEPLKDQAGQVRASETFPFAIRFH